MNKLSSQDRDSLIRLAFYLPNGDKTRRAVLAGLSKISREFPSSQSLQEYLSKHPRADEKRHSVREPKNENTKKPSKGEPSVSREERYDKKFRDETVKSILGKNVSDKELANLVGADFLGSDYKVSVSTMGRAWVQLSVSGPHIEKMVRRLRQSEGDPPTVENVHLKLSDDAPPGFGTNLLLQQATDAKNMGIKQITTGATRDDEKGYVGHYVWPRLGYDGDIPENSLKKVKKAIKEGDLPKSLSSAKKVSDLMGSKEGRDWWKANGETFSATFDLDSSMGILQEYAEAKSKSKTSSKIKLEGDDFLKLTVEDEEVLDRIWAKRHSK